MTARTASSVSLVLLVAALGACGGGSNGGSGDGSGGGDAGGDVVPTADAGSGTAPDAGSDTDPTAGAPDDRPADGNPPVPAGDITSYGVVALGDRAGLASDALASFARLPSGIATAAFGNALTPDGEPCDVTPAGAADMMDLSVVFVPRPPGTRPETIEAGETVLLSGNGGSGYVELLAPSFGPFYEPSGGALPPGAIPDTVLVDVSGGTFPAFGAVPMPTLETLEEVDIDGTGADGSDTLTRDTRFTWRAGGTDRDTRIRITTSTTGGFFREDGLDVACLVPDTGEFVFPPAVRDALGAAFTGERATLSRVAVSTQRRDEALLILVRESFAP